MSEDARAYLSAEHPAAAALATWTLEAVLAADPSLEARVRRGWHAITFHHEDAGYVCGLFPGADGTVRLFLEHGGALPDPEGVLQGEGLRGRWLPVREAGDVTAQRIRGFVHDAIVRRVLR